MGVSTTQHVGMGGMLRGMFRGMFRSHVWGGISICTAMALNPKNMCFRWLIGVGVVLGQNFVLNTLSFWVQASGLQPGGMQNTRA